jgi:putative hemolysin
MSEPATASINPFNINDTINIARYQTVNIAIGSMLSQISGLKILENIYKDNSVLAKSNSPDEFISKTLDLLDIKYQITSGQIKSIPNKKGLVIVANHPFGGLDGLILAHIIKQVRSDVKILANGFLKKIPAMESLFFDVDPINQKKAMQKNIVSLKHTVRWVKDGGCLIVFPAGEVSHLTLKDHRVSDPDWNETIAKLILLTESSVLPVFFQGKNSIYFQLLGLIHPYLRTILLPRELLKKSNSKIELNIGQTINFNRIKKLESKTLIKFLRLTTYALGSKKQKTIETKTSTVELNNNIINAIPSKLLAEEIFHLPVSQILHETNKVKVIYADSKQIPWTLQEIGRLREITFREAGEGTGKDIDIDIYDTYYTHLFLWDKEKQCIIGAYRLGLTDIIINKFGIKGLYSHSLFKYSEKQIHQLGASIELGRSFICSEYQRQPSSLSLLWKGIGCFIASESKYHTVFGPVSISNDYQDASRKLIVDSLRVHRLMKTPGKKIKPRKAYKATDQVYWNKKELGGLDNIDVISEIISQMEQGQRGIPVLIKQYIKLGGHFLEFNVDKEFNNALDGLIVVDLRNTEPGLLEYFMGKEKAEHYLNNFKPTHEQFRKVS